MKLVRHAMVLLVEDVARAAAYYHEALGFQVELYSTLPDHYAYTQRDGCSIHFAHFEGVRPRPNSAVVPPDMFLAFGWAI